MADPTRCRRCQHAEKSHFGNGTCAMPWCGCTGWTPPGCLTCGGVGVVHFGWCPDKAPPPPERDTLLSEERVRAIRERACTCLAPRCSDVLDLLAHLDALTAAFTAEQTAHAETRRALEAQATNHRRQAEEELRAVRALAWRGWESHEALLNAYTVALEPHYLLYEALQAARRERDRLGGELRDIAAALTAEQTCHAETRLQRDALHRDASKSINAGR